LGEKSSPNPLAGFKVATLRQDRDWKGKGKGEEGKEEGTGRVKRRGNSALVVGG